MSESADSNISHDCFIEKRHDLEMMARGVEGGVGRNDRDWCTEADECALRPYTAMVRIAALLSTYPSSKSVASYAKLILDCTERHDKSLDEIYAAGEQKKFLGLFQRLEELYKSTDFQS